MFATTKTRRGSPIHKLYLYLTGSGKSIMAASKSELPISKRVDKKETKVQRLYTCFRGPATNETIKNVV